MLSRFMKSEASPYEHKSPQRKLLTPRTPIQWEHQEVTFQDIHSPVAKEMEGYAKIVNACAAARNDQFEYIWIDTCCIDKTSSAELSEAINSMHHWYEESIICYAYLSDVTVDENDSNLESAISASRWFKRGWTLQELIAPSFVTFLN